MCRSRVLIWTMIPLSSAVMPPIFRYCGNPDWVLLGLLTGSKMGIIFPTRLWVHHPSFGDHSQSNSFRLVSQWFDSEGTRLARHTDSQKELIEVQEGHISLIAQEKHLYSLCPSKNLGWWWCWWCEIKIEHLSQCYSECYWKRCLTIRASAR